MVVWKREEEDKAIGEKDRTGWEEGRRAVVVFEVGTNELRSAAEWRDG
jgi:hypothetical protein